MDGVTDDVECPSGPFCTDTDGDGIPNYNDPDHNTWVQHVSLRAMAGAQGVQVQWRTGFERGNLGFHIERHGDGGPVRITSAPIGGTAFLGGPATPFTAGYSHAWHDPAGMVNDVYSVVSIDLDGRETRHGPITARADASTTSPLVSSPWLGHLGKQASRARPVPRRRRPSRISGPSVTTPQQPRAWEQAELTSRDIQWAIVADPALKIRVDASGWYEIGQPALVQAGLDEAVDPRYLQLFVQGEEQPVLVMGEADGTLDPSDTLAFYSPGLDTAWSATQVHWLVVGTQPGLRIPLRASPPSPPGPRSFPDTVTHKARQLYVAAVRNGAAENFFGAVLNTEPVEQTFFVDHLDPATLGDARLQIALQGVTSGSHRVAVAVNGQAVHTLNFSGASHQTDTVALPQRHLRDGANIITLTPESPETVVSLVDALHLTYWRTYQARDNNLHCTVPGERQVTIGGFQHPNIRVFDLTAPADMHELLGGIERHGDEYTITVITPPGAERTLLAVAAPRLVPADAIEANVPSSWHASEEGANFIIIAHPAFLDALVPLKHLREQQGWTVALIDVDDLYAAFTYGVKHPEAIQAFLRHAMHHWPQPPRYVLLAGDASFDPRDYLGYGMTDFIPTRWVDTNLMETASDDAYADPDGDGIADLYVGRLPAQSADEATIMVNKLLAYATASGDWLRRALMVTDIPGPFDFEGAAHPLRQRLEQSLNVTTIALGQRTPLAAQEHLHQQLESGQLLVIYQGHGSVQRWTAGGVLTSVSARTLSNAGQLPVVSSMTCLNGYFQDPQTESLAEALLRAPHGGAAAVWASSGLTRPTSQAEMQRALIAHLLRPERPTLGEAIQAAKSAITDLDVRRTWILFGDPTLRLPR
ncbi:C25 family cysteine peptidase [Candidatus Entotheonella palauensis]|nr:C25 family cysteine peptidase [Candidatus Entotheonella palauensis]